MGQTTDLVTKHPAPDRQTVQTATHDRT